MVKFITTYDLFLRPNLWPSHALHAWSLRDSFRGTSSLLGGIGELAEIMNTCETPYAKLMTWHAGFMTNFWLISFLSSLWPFMTFSIIDVWFEGLFLIYDHCIHPVHNIQQNISYLPCFEIFVKNHRISRIRIHVIIFSFLAY